MTSGYEAAQQDAPENLAGLRLWSVTWSQLKIKIDPELLQRLSSHAARQGATLTESVVSVLAKAISGDELMSLEERVTHGASSKCSIAEIRTMAASNWQAPLRVTGALACVSSEGPPSEGDGADAQRRQEVDAFAGPG